MFQKFFVEISQTPKSCVMKCRLTDEDFACDEIITMPYNKPILEWLIKQYECRELDVARNLALYIAAADDREYYLSALDKYHSRYAKRVRELLVFS